MRDDCMCAHVSGGDSFKAAKWRSARQSVGAPACYRYAMLPLRNLVLLALAAASLSLYIPISRGRPKRLCGMLVDQHIPFLPVFVVPYLSLFIFFPAAIILVYPTPFAALMYLALGIVGLLYAVVSPFVGCSAARADARGPGALHALVRFVYRIDGKYNNDVFPSTHVYISVICGYYLARAFPAFALWSWIVAVCIAFSTVFIKQHNLMDIAGGLLWAATAIVAAQSLIGLLV